MGNQVHTQIDDFQIFELWAKYKHLWPWILLSVTVCVGIALAYIRMTSPKYLRTASVMIKENRISADLSTVVSDKLVVSMNSSVKNEVEAFQSFKLVQDVVRELNLTTSYVQKKPIKSVRLYEHSPVEVFFPESSEDESFKFIVDFYPDNKVVLSRFEYNDIKIKHQEIKGKLNEMNSIPTDTIITPISKIIITKTKDFGNYGFKYPLEISKNSIQGETRSFVKKLKVSLASKENSIINLEIIDTYIPRAEQFLNTLIEGYNKNWLEDKNKFAQSTSDFLNERLPMVEKELRDIENEMERYKSEHRLTDVYLIGSNVLSQSNNNVVKMMEVNTQISITRFIKDYLDKNDNNSTMIPYNPGLKNSAIETQMVQYNALLTERDALLTNSSEKNAQVIALNNKLQSMRQAIVQSVNTQIETLDMQLSSLRTQDTQMTQQIASNPGQERHLVTLERERKTKENLFLLLLKQKEDNDMALVMDINNTRIISPPSGNVIPVAPKKMLVLMIALIFGVGIPGSVIWGKENLNTVIRGKNDLEGLSVPLLGVIALANGESQKNGEYMRVSETGRDMINETFRMVRTGMDFACGKDMKVVMFTSFEPGCGKTFIALNLAMSFALAGKKVALIDTDMRLATLSKISEWPPKSSEETTTDFGIRYYLDGGVSYTSLLQYHIRKNRYYKRFDIFPVGAIPLNPTELLMCDRFSKMLEHLRMKYDYVFLDCTPLDVLTDANIVSKLADLSVFIVREDFTDRRKLRELEKTYRKGQFNNMAMILNGVKLDVSFNKHHNRYQKKIKEVAKQIRGSELMKELPQRGTKEPQNETKLITQGSNESHKLPEVWQT